MTDTPAAAPTPTPPGTTPDFHEMLNKGFEATVYDWMGGDAALKKYAGEHPDDLKSMITTFDSTKAQIDAETALNGLSLEMRMGLLIWTKFKEMWSGDSTDKAPEAAQSLVEQLKNKVGTTLTFDVFKAFWAGKPEATAPLLLDAAHSVWRGAKLLDFVTMTAALNTSDADALKNWPLHFPYALGTRIVSGQSAAVLKESLGCSQAKQIMESLGIKFTFVEEGATPVKPADNEIQVLSLVDGDYKEAKDWDTIKAKVPLWEESVPAQYESCPKTLAALATLEEKGPMYSTPEDICKQVGYANPDAAFLEWLKTVPRS